MPDTNHVLLLRHCIRSTKTEIKTCDGSIETKANISDYLNAELADFGVPPMWCTEKGLDVIKEQGQYLINEIILPVSISGSYHVHINLISDLSHRDVDTTVALATGMKEALSSISNSSSTRLTFAGLDDFTIAREIFKPEGNDDEDKMTPPCPLTEYSPEELSDQIVDRITKYLPLQKVQAMIELVIRLGGVERNGPFGEDPFHYDKNDPSRCSTDGLGFQLNLLKQIAEMAAYSRASGVFPPFLPNATNDEVYQMLSIVDMLRTLDNVDNIKAAKYGLVLAKSMLAALQVPTTPPRSDGVHTSTITIFVGHDSSIDDIATVLGLRWKLPNRQGADDFDEVVSTPPGSGLIFTSSGYDSSDDLTVSYVYQENLIEGRNRKTSYRSVGVFATNKSLEKGRDAEKSIKSVLSLHKRLDATLHQYPELHACFGKAPIVPQKSTIGNYAALEIIVPVLLALAAFNALILSYNLVRCVWFGRNQTKHQDLDAAVEGQLEVLHDELELT